jgi:GT2 family glycosyltransferase
VSTMIKEGDLVSFWDPDTVPSSKTLDCFVRRVKRLGVVVVVGEKLCSVMHDQKFYSRRLEDVSVIREEHS